MEVIGAGSILPSFFQCKEKDNERNGRNKLDDEGTKPRCLENVILDIPCYSTMITEHLFPGAATVARGTICHVLAHTPTSLEGGTYINFDHMPVKSYP